jgi:hypothetical protein
MKVYLDTQNSDFADKDRPRRRFIADLGDCAEFAGSCPACGVKPFRAFGKEKSERNDRDIVAEGFCKDCGAHVGLIVVETNTLFGLKEDRAVLQGRCRVY